MTSYEQAHAKNERRLIRDSCIGALFSALTIALVVA